MKASYLEHLKKFTIFIRRIFSPTCNMCAHPRAVLDIIVPTHCCMMYDPSLELLPSLHCIISPLSDIFYKVWSRPDLDSHSQSVSTLLLLPDSYNNSYYCQTVITTLKGRLERTKRCFVCPCDFLFWVFLSSPL